MYCEKNILIWNECIVIFIVFMVRKDLSKLENFSKIKENFVFYFY